MYSKSLVIPALFAALGVAQEDVQYETRTATITQCFTRDGLRPPATVTVPGPTCVVHKPAVTGEAIIVEVQAPDCHCGCPTCVHTLEYTTKYPAFCSTGLFEQEYVITETYSGMEAKPTKNEHDLPYGFTCEVQTCTTCGPEPVTATITHPVSGHYMNEVAPTEMPMAKPGKEQPGKEQPGKEQPGKEQPEEQGNAAPKVTGDDSGFRSSVKPTPVPNSPESASPGESTDHPVIVSGAMSQHLGLAGAGIAFFALIQFLFL
ncbi:uncharacterized protein FFUJ_07770 [Fusarium fujikuroi IMI 58289]|uniref:Uncharacterized protein n=1 Tax=Gibberella fujikuroi (strain CBS 195.34 / IMI 58289 / NRRL A-6831) TaxID=1279085 RepID=S0E8Z3_GIBF5|nr:uncharacterized protein FFUJ_07770 [Fusarium fujikuroi IMI 58289]QGI95772.1 hypothetical protein CEK26_008841 [Fusarium fujikuroi]CCT68943.1 uncharacterized protein FFUJ_07770 [Fusarium fujikuroi IMI 58289]SCO07081.1 uncharacterized protein FFM5_08964 [Fusarium fujikuroi]SCV29881.1 uncharacterized protein FFB14_02771 [Fusarium fujikuroi]